MIDIIKVITSLMIDIAKALTHKSNEIDDWYERGLFVP